MTVKSSPSDNNSRSSLNSLHCYRSEISAGAFASCDGTYVEISKPFSDVGVVTAVVAAYAPNGPCVGVDRLVHLLLELLRPDSQNRLQTNGTVG